jgi:peroxiredoxin
LKDDPNIVFLIISRDDDTNKVKTFMDKKGYSLPVFTPASRTPSMLHTNVLPTTYIIGADGAIVSQHEGMADYDNDRVINSLRTLSEQAASL